MIDGLSVFYVLEMELCFWFYIILLESLVFILGWDKSLEMFFEFKVIDFFELVVG